MYVYLFISSIVALYKDSCLYFFPLLLKLFVSVSPVSILYNLSCFIQFPLFLVCKYKYLSKMTTLKTNYRLMQVFRLFV